MNWSVKTVNQIELKWSPYWFLILVNSGFRNINLAANIPLLFTSCSRILKCLIVNCPMWSTVQNIGQSRKRLLVIEFSFVRNDRQPSQKSGMRQEKDLFPTIPDDRRYLRFRVFVSGQNFRRSGNTKIYERLVFSRHINARFKQAKKS